MLITNIIHFYIISVEICDWDYIFGRSFDIDAHNFDKKKKEN